METYKDILKEHGYRVTPGRLELLSFLACSKHPSTVGEIQEGLRDSMDKVTLYRALDDFVSSKIVERVNLNNGAASYEFVHKNHHHHHIVCERCGKVEDVENCNQSNLQKEALKKSNGFAVVTSHSLEFFGICKVCIKTC